MLPVVLIGDNTKRIGELEEVIQYECTAPVRYVEIDSKSLQQIPLPALTCPSILFIDIDGEMTEALGRYISKLHATYADSAVVVLLQFGDTEGEQAAIRAGADEVLIKPVSPSRIALSMRNLSEIVSLRSNGRSGNFIAKHISGALTVSLLNSNGQIKRLHHIEQEAIRSTISYFGGHISNAAKALGIGRSTLYRKVDLQSIGDMPTTVVPLPKFA